MLFQAFMPFELDVDGDITIFGVRKGAGPPLLLLHGFPENHLMWHRIARRLAQKYSVVAIDLRGYGKSSKPAGDDSHAIYSKRTMAKDCIAVMTKLGHAKFYICAHDRGARVAHQLCIDHPSHVEKAILLDIAPTLAMYEQADMLFATAYYHWFLLIQKSPFPETLISANPEAFMDYQMGGRHSPTIQIFDSEAYDSYLEAMRDPAAVHAMCEDYRAAATIDLEHQREDIKEGRKIQCPLMILWGKNGLIEKKYDAIAEWKKVSASTVEGEALDCGHYIPEELPETLLEKIETFLTD
ncbi:uncharacterized protein KY384_004566 [Bacidia gigantensis]|uniref:uncharacterized protein n=1 Tax=Bacidia gigantensis TaxID=2732470 RepID=UPI001D03CF74|nr:uncharacterized protein KY384_004566 [Bacidia gigantensis]KAG8531208.1 hypothetical protein KY384_004566 [Bacidia gigantensis]